MPSLCVSSARLTAFLAGELEAADEQAVAEHLDVCPSCDSLAAELSDDGEARELAAAAEGKQPVAAHAEPQVEDLCRRLHALGLYELAANRADDDTRPNMDQSPRRTAVFKPVKVQTTVTPPGHAPAEPASPEPLIPEAPRLRRLGRYEIVRSLGAGTFGVVYLATDMRLHRPVALKIARATVVADDHLRLRFVREAETLAKLQHPHIVPVYEADEVEGLCYLAIAFCDGPTLEQWLSEAGPLDPELAVRLLLPLVEAVEHAHLHGVLHRDIKPANVILEKAEGQDAALPFVPKLTDFGLAKVVEEKTSSTLSGVVLGTAQYMAPEQAAGHVERIGPATDVYALGAVLYQMLTGRPPIEGNTTIDTLRRLLIDDPAEVRSLVSDVPADLDAIVLRCLNKSVTDRYSTAAELAADLRRFLDGLPTLARPLTAHQRVSRWIRRNPMRTALATLATIIVGLTIGLYDYSARLSRSQNENRWAETNIRSLKDDALAAAQRVLAEERTRYQLEYSYDIRMAALAMSESDVVQALARLKRQIPPPNGPQPDLRGLEWHYLWSLATQAPLAQARAGTEVYQIRLSPDGRELAAACKDGWLRLYDLRTLTRCKQIEVKSEINGVAYSPDGRLLAAVSDDGIVRVYDLLDLDKPPLSFTSGHPKTYAVAFYDGSRKLVTCGHDQYVRFWDVTSKPVLIAEVKEHTDVVEALAVSPDGRMLATASSDKTCVLWDLEKPAKIRSLPGHSGRLSSVCFSPDGTRLATGGLDKTVGLWALDTGRRLSTETHLDAVQTVAFDASGQCLFAGDRSGSLRRYRIVAGTANNPHVKLVRDESEDTWQAHDIRVWCAIPGGDDKTLITAGADGLIRVWQTDLRRPARRSLGATPDDLIVDLAFSPDGDILFALHETSGIELLDGATLESRGWLHSRHTRWYSLAVLGDIGEVAAGNAHGLVSIWNWKTGLLRPPIDSRENFTVTKLLYSPAARLLAVLPYEVNGVRLYRADTGEYVDRLPTDNHASAAFSPDGKHLAVDWLDNICVYDVPTRKVVQTLVGHTATIYGLAFNPSGDLLASASGDRTVRLWSGGIEQRSIGGHRAFLADVAFTPDNQTLVSIDDAGVLKLSHVAADRMLMDIPTETYCLRALAVAPDSRRLAVLREDHSILLIGNPEPPKTKK